MTRWFTMGLIVAAGCSTLELAPPAEIIHARFDPDARVIPMPTDVLRDDALGRLDVPLDADDLTEAEREFFGWLNTLDGWSSAMPATVELSAPIAADSVTSDTLQIWHWRETPRLVSDAAVTVDESGTKITIDAPRDGWERGGRYVVMMRGGASGVEGKRGEQVECDAAFYFLRLAQRLDVPEHERAFPGETRAERQDNARKLEEIRVELAPYFDFFEDRGIARREVAALWTFTITERTELAMDKASQRMPLPMNLLLDPDTGRIDLPAAEWDTPTVVRAKERLREYDGFAISANLMFGFTGPIDPATLDPESVQLYQLTEPPRLLPAQVVVLPDGVNVELVPEVQPLEERTRYAVVVRSSVRDIDGEPISLMPVGHLVRARAPVFAGGRSQLDAVDDDDARRVERVRREVAPLVDALGDDVLAAWTFDTMSVSDPIEELMRQPALLGVPTDPADVRHMTPVQALVDFPLAIGSLFQVGAVYHGTIKSPVFLDPLTRAWRGDNGYELQDVAFTMAVPRGLDPHTPAPVAIFGHGIMTERRFVLALADALAARGFVAVAIDFPFHGERTYCWSEGPLSVPHPSTGELTPVQDPCMNGTTCAEDGRCVDALGQGNHLRKWPVIGMYQASGAAYIEIEHIANTRDHFRQTLIDLAALSRSLREGDWESVIGAPLETDTLYYVGQSLGGIIGGTFVAWAPEVERAVLNVPGVDLVDMFDDSPFFSGHVDAFFRREGVDRQSFDGYRFLNVARWFMDAVDPQGFTDRLTHRREVMVQMALLDFIIPNTYTRKLTDGAGVPQRDYLAEHAFLSIPVEPEYLRGVNEMAGFLAGTFQP